MWNMSHFVYRRKYKVEVYDYKSWHATRANFIYKVKLYEIHSSFTIPMDRTPLS